MSTTEPQTTESVTKYSTKMDIDQIDALYRSRITILDILEGRGYDTSPYRKFSPAEIAIASNYIASLNISLKMRDAPDKTCELIYSKSNATTLNAFLDEADPDAEYIILTFQDNLEKHHAVTAKQYLARGMRAFVFNIPHIVNNPLMHIMVPKHTIVPKEEHADLLKGLYVSEKRHLLHITSADPIVRCIGALPGDIIRIDRPSPNSGTYTIYRLVVA
jgi:DNA-directed RNA polymerase subunit H (RpoH/RPB5)